MKRVNRGSSVSVSCLMHSDECVHGVVVSVGSESVSVEHGSSPGHIMLKGGSCCSQYIKLQHLSNDTLELAFLEL